tara:strand:+ start:149 stop:547 length:399 start_codon:yes stop_codon:yes gene_type:complete
MLDTQLIESYKAQMMRSFIELWLKLCPDHRISIERGMGGHRLSIILPDSFAERLTFPKNSPIQTIKKTTTYRDEYGSTSANRERVLESQIECDELRAAAKKDEEDGFLSVEEMNKVITDIEKDKDGDGYIPA